MSWVRVEDRLPEKQGMYLVVFNMDERTRVSYSLWEQKARGKFGWRSRERVRRKASTHWMPLPKRPEEE